MQQFVILMVAVAATAAVAAVNRCYCPSGSFTSLSLMLYECYSYSGVGVCRLCISSFCMDAMHIPTKAPAFTGVAIGFCRYEPCDVNTMFCWEGYSLPSRRCLVTKYWLLTQHGF